jgi:hypothetical protein
MIDANAKLQTEALSWPFCGRVSSASSRSSTWASVYRPKRHRPWRQAPLARSPESWSLNERLVCESLPRSAIYEAVEPCQGMALDVALVQSEREFVNVAVQMLRAGVMIDANQAALQDSKDALDAVGCHILANVFASAVVGLVDEAQPWRSLLANSDREISYCCSHVPPNPN